MIPAFDLNGNLPPGIHEASWQEVERRFGTNAHRMRLLRGLREILEKLLFCGCQRCYLDGSFVSAEGVPSDFDGAWELSSVDLRKLQIVEPLIFDFSNNRAAQKAKYHGEMFPAEVREGNSGMTFIEFFQVDKNSGDPKGIIAINLRTLR